MVAFSHPRRSAWGAVFVLALTFAAAAEVSAKSRTKSSADRGVAARVDDIPIPKFSDTATKATVRPDAQATPQMRFFTINGALAKFDGRPTGDRVRLAALAPANEQTDAPPISMSPARGDGPFGMFSFRAPEGALWTKWRQVQAAVSAEEHRIAECSADASACDSASRVLIAMARRASELRDEDRFKMVTHTVNATIRYVSDFTAHGVVDVWSSPLKTLDGGLGDCEDYAILKYQVLRQAGTPASDLKIVLLRDAVSHEDHAVLAARNGERWYILDNRGAGFFPDHALPKYRPLFGLDAVGVHAFAVPYVMRSSTAELLPGTDNPPSNLVGGGATGALPLLM